MAAFLNGPEWFHASSHQRQHGIYRSPTIALAAWFYGWMLRLFTLPGRFLLPSTALILMYSSVAMFSPVRALSILLGVIFAADFFLGMIFRPKLQISRQIPERVRAGAAFEINYAITNRRKITAWDIVLDAYNLQEGVKWLSHGTAGTVPFGENIKTTARLEAHRRGKYQIYSPIAESMFPLSIFKWSCCCKKTSDPLLVYPSFFPLNSLILPVGLKYQKDGVSRVSKVGESMDFFGCRDFREGDDPRHIDWPGSARTNEIIIKEYQDEYLSRIALIVDTFVPKMKSFRLTSKKDLYFEELEAALSLTAALTDYLTRGEYVVDIFAAGLQVYHFQSGRHLTCFDGILDILACLEPNNEHPINRLSPSVLEEVSGIGSAVLILLGWDKEREELVNKLRNSNVALKTIIVRPPSNTNSIPDDIQIVSIDDIKSGRVRNL